MDIAERHISFSQMLQAMQLHQQGHHGWRLLHEALACLHKDGLPTLCRMLASCWRLRPHISDAHLVTLLGIAVRNLARRNPVVAPVFDPKQPFNDRVGALHKAFVSHEEELSMAIFDHSNSFTGARRFLLPQLVIGHFARTFGIAEVRLLDLGTGLGILPRQLNHRDVYQRFAEHLIWHPDAPEYVEIPLTARHGVDAHPLPTVEWVRTCHGPSHYYEQRFEELMWSWNQTADVEDSVRLEELDLLDLEALTGYIRQHEFNVVCASFVLYQYDETTREDLVRTVVTNIEDPGLFLSMEPSHDLMRMGCRVEAYLAGDPAPLHVADVSDAHFMGMVTPGPDLSALIGRDDRR